MLYHHAGLFARVYDSSKQDGPAACLDVLAVMIKPFILQIQGSLVPKGCHLLNGVYVKPVTLAVLNLVHVGPYLALLLSGLMEPYDADCNLTAALHFLIEYSGMPDKL